MLKFSIITPVYNGEKFISKCIEAIASINYDKELIEHIIIDDGSTDKTKEICLKYTKQFKHVKFYSKSNGNWGSAINYTKKHKLVNGDYIVICDADDFLDKEVFNIINAKANSSDVIVGNYKTFTDIKVKGKCINYFYFFKRNIKNKKDLSLFLSPTIAPTCFYIKREIFYQTPKLVEGVMYQDTVLYMHCMRKSHTMLYIPKTISYYRKEQVNNTMALRFTDRGVKSYEARFNVWMKYDCVENIALDLMFTKTLRNKLISLGKTYNFNRKPCFRMFPIWMRIFVALIYKITCNKLIKIIKK